MLANEALHQSNKAGQDRGTVRAFKTQLISRSDMRQRLKRQDASTGQERGRHAMHTSWLADHRECAAEPCLAEGQYWGLTLP